MDFQLMMLLAIVGGTMLGAIIRIVSEKRR